MHPMEAALRFVVEHIAKHGDGPSSQLAQQHLAAMDAYMSSAPVPPAPVDAYSIKPLVEEIVKDVSQAAAEGAVQGVKAAI